MSKELKLEPRKKIVWAVDPSSIDNTIEEHAIKLIGLLQQASNAEIHPVYVATPTSVNVPLEFFPMHMDMLLDKVEENFSEALKPFSLQGLKELKVLVKPIASMLGAVKELNAYAHKIKADVIVVGTHARKGVPRLFLGSFAETLLLHATTPIVTVGPKMNPLQSIESILFPTDLGAKSENDLERIVAFAKEHRSKITIFHCVTHPKENEASARRKANALAAVAHKAGVTASAIVSVADLPLANAIIKMAAEQNAQLIAMAPRSGWIAAALIGSTARQVVRASDKPVWLLHEQSIKMGKHRKRKAA